MPRAGSREPMMNKTMTHRGTWKNHNYGKPISRVIELRETANYWVDKQGTKYRKTDGCVAGADMWSQTTLDLQSIQPIAPREENSGT